MLSGGEMRPNECQQDVAANELHEVTSSFTVAFECIMTYSVIDDKKASECQWLYLGSRKTIQ